MSSLRNPARHLGRGLLAAAVTSALLVPSASASGIDVWKECIKTGGEISTTHSQADFKDALTNPPADGAEYSNCLDAIRAAQNAKGLGSAGGGGTGGSGGGATNPGAPTGGGSAPAPSPATAAVQPADLVKAISATGIDPGAKPGAEPVVPVPVTVAGDAINLQDGRMPSLASAFSLPLPVAASAVIVMMAAALPVVRFVAARFGATPTTPTEPPTP